jgi:hypothetical protein
MKKIKAKAEGRENIWIPEKESLKAWIKNKKFEQIHNFIPSGNIILGADHSVESVLKDIDNADRIAVFTNGVGNMGHALSIIKDEKLECYDIGELNDKDILTQHK